MISIKLNNAWVDRFLASSETVSARCVSQPVMARKQNFACVSHPVHQAGFSLVELMVGMVVGLLAIFAIMQSFGAFEGQKRTTTSGADTQENGLIALETIASDARWAGYGLATPPGIKNAPGLACIQMNWFESAQSGVANVAPVVVVDGGASGVSDTLTFTGATSPTARAPLPINTDVLPGGDPDIANLVGFKQDVDLYLLAEPVTSPGTAAAALPCVRRAFTSGAASPNAKYNTADAAIYPPGGYPKNVGFVVNIGSDQNEAAGLRQMEYSVSAVAAASGVASSDLVARNVSHQGAIATPTATLASNIVNIQVQYGVAPPNTTNGASSPSVNCWTDATGTGCAYTGTNGTWAAPDARNVMRIKAIRMAVVARSPLKEKPATPGGACTTTPNALTAWTGGPAIDLTADADWQCYRYRIYETVIPLRNVIWANL